MIFDPSKIQCLGRTTEDLVPSANARSNLIVLRLSVAEGVELGLCEYVSTIFSEDETMRTSDAMSDPPNQTAYLQPSQLFCTRRGRRTLTFGVCAR